MSMLMEKVFVLSAKKYAFTDTKTGELKEGVTVFYVPALDPTISEDGITKGQVPVKANFALSQFESFQSLPGVYDIEYDIVPTSTGKLNFKYISAKSKTNK